MNPPISKITQKELQLVDRGLICVTESGKFGFTPYVKKNGLFMLIDRTYQKMHPQSGGQHCQNETEFNEALDGLIMAGFADRTTDGEHEYIGLTREGGFQLLLCFLRE